MRLFNMTFLCVSVVAATITIDCRAEQATPISFYAMGDVPYAEGEYGLLREQLQQIPQTAPFVIHLGDIKRGNVPCEPGVYQRVAGVLKTCPVPLFIIPGDNEWNDCTDPTNAWKLWGEHFLKFDQHWKHGIAVERQPEQVANFAFVKEQTLFIGINLVGGRVHDAAEWKKRHSHNLQWVTQLLKQHSEAVHSVVLMGHAAPKFDHSDFFLPLVQLFGASGKPLLYIHGDGHVWVYDQPFVPKNIFRVQVDQGGIAPPVKVTVTGKPQEPFVFDRRK